MTEILLRQRATLMMPHDGGRPLVSNVPLPEAVRAWAALDREARQDARLVVGGGQILCTSDLDVLARRIAA